MRRSCFSNQVGLSQFRKLSDGSVNMGMSAVGICMDTLEKGTHIAIESAVENPYIIIILLYFLLIQIECNCRILVLLSRFLHG